MSADVLASPMPGSSNLETFYLFWLDAAVDGTEENIETQQRLRSSINHLTTFARAHQCEQDIRSLSRQDRVVLIVSDQLGREVVPRIHSLPQLSSIYVYCMDKKKNKEWVIKFAKVKGVFVQLDKLVVRIQSDQQTRNSYKVDETLPISIFNSSVGQGKSTTGMNGQFIHSQLLMDCLLRMKSMATVKNELVSVCKEEYQGNAAELNIIREFEQNYAPDRAVWWYTRDSFVYRLMNKALRVQNIDLLFLLRFFIRDLEQQLREYQCSSCVRLYRGQLMAIDELQMLKDSIGKLISINSFLSTSINRQVASAFLTQSTCSDDTERVLFEIVADPQLNHAKPFANITSASYFPREEEVIMMVGSIFRLVDVRCNNGRYWIVQMKLCSDRDDHDLKLVYDQMKTENGESDTETNTLSFGDVLFNMGKYDDAEKYFSRLLNELSREHEDVVRCYDALGNVCSKKDDLDSSLAWHYKSLEIKMKKLRTNDPELGKSYTCIGTVLRKKGDLDQALKAYKKALPIFQQAYGDEHQDIASCLTSMGFVYLRLKDYWKAMDCFENGLSINRNYFPEYHPVFGILHSSVADAHRCLQNYDKAIEHVAFALKIFEKSLPPEHYRVAWVFEILGNVHEERKELADALCQYRKAAKVYCETLRVSHYYVVGVKQSIERVLSQIG